MDQANKSFPIDELIGSINWDETAELFTYIIGRELMKEELAIEKEFMRSRLLLINKLNIPYLPCKYWVIKQKIESDDIKKIGQKIKISFRSIEYHFRVAIRTGNINVLEEPDDPEFDFFKRLLDKESDAEMYENCAMIKKHLDMLIEAWDPYTYPI